MGSENRPEQASAADPAQPQVWGQPIDNVEGLQDVQLPRFLGSGRVHSRRLDRKDKTLSFFPLTLQGSAVVLELRNNVFLRGMLYMADIHMKYVNMRKLAACHWTFRHDKRAYVQEEPAEFEWMYVKARTLRMMHLDKNMDFKAFVMSERAQTAAQHAQRKVSVLSNNPADLTVQDDARPEGF